MKGKIKNLLWVGLLAAALFTAVTLISCKPKEAAKEAKVPEAPKFKIGLAFDVGGRGDKSFNDSAYAGIVHLAKDFKGYIAGDPDKVDFGKEIELKYLEPKSGGQDREQLLRIMAEDGYNLVIGVGFMYSDALGKVAKDFPNVHFGIIDGWLPDLNENSNITCLGFTEHEGSFLVGAIAGLKNKKLGGKLGFIGGMDMPLIHKFQAGFYAGAMYVDPKMREKGMLLGQYCGKDGSAFNDPKTGESIAINMYKQGATIIYHAAGGSGNGLFKAAKDMDKIAIGVDSDQGYGYATGDNEEEKAMAKHILTSMLKRVDNAVYLTGKEMIDNGKVVGGYTTFNLKVDGVGYAQNEFNKDKLADVKAEVDKLKEKIISGEIAVPDNDSQLPDWMAKTF